MFNYVKFYLLLKFFTRYSKIMSFTKLEYLEKTNANNMSNMPDPSLKFEVYDITEEIKNKDIKFKLYIIWNLTSLK